MGPGRSAVGRERAHLAQLAADYLAKKARHAGPLAVSPFGFEGLGLVSRSEPIEAVPACSLNASSPEPDEPDD
jgi:hypothetical protein